MQTFRVLLVLFFVLYCVIAVAEVSAQRSKPPSKPSLWQTLKGNAPIVIARGGFSGIFPDSSFNAYSLAVMTSLPNVVLWCDVQLTKDAAGICLPFVTINNSTNIDQVQKNGKREYMVNGVATSGWFSLDFTLDDLLNVSLTQGIGSRSDRFDGNLFSILTVEDLTAQVKPPGLWLNIQHNSFYAQHNLSMRSFVLSVSRRVIVNYISSPEVGFLRSIMARFSRSVTKLVFRFLDADAIEPSTNQTYSTLSKNLTFIKTFASGILVPKSYIWPVNGAQYLQQPHTSIVSDAHREGLEVFASDFANDGALSYNYSYDPVLEYLSFVDNGDFSVDGVLSDFPITPSSSIDCFSHISKNSSGQANPKVISHNGASGVYPGSTDVAYKQAVEDGVDFIDCSIQMTSDGIPICLSSINLFDCTNVAQSPFNNLSMTVAEIQENSGIFTFSLSWKNIKSLTPVIKNPWQDGYNMLRNPAYKNAGSFLSLADFLTFAIDKPLAGVVIIVENAAYLAAEQGLNVTGAVLDAISNSGYKNQTVQEVIIQSTNKSVLLNFKKKSKYKLMYRVDENIRDADDASLKDIKRFTDLIAISKDSVYPENRKYIIGETNIVKRLHSFNFTVYLFLFENEFLSQAWDFFSDPYVEINSFVMGAAIDGVITDFPGTAVMYRRNRCLTMKNIPIYMSPVKPGGLMGVMTKNDQPPAEAPNPVLTEEDIAEPPLPPVTKPATLTPNTDGSAPGPTPPSPSGHPRLAAGVLLSFLFTLLACLLLH